MKKIIYIIFLSFFIPSPSTAQSYFGKTAIISSYYAPFFHSPSETLADIDYWEHSWHKTIGVRLTKNIYLEMNHINIYAKHISPPALQRGNLRNFLLGLQGSYRMSVTEKLGFKGQVGFYIGNHCTCGRNNPFQMDDLRYINWGLDIDYRLVKRLYLNLGFRAHLLANDIVEKYGYTGGVIGLDFLLGQEY